jgi:hypothetical protein
MWGFSQWRIENIQKGPAKKQKPQKGQGPKV